MNKLEALSRAMKICSLKEYAPKEIEEKLISWGVSEDDSLEIIETLVEDKFLDEFRMSRFYANDKLRFNKWGRIKIKFQLQQKQIKSEAISEALNQLNETEYHTILLYELQKKRKSIRNTDKYEVKAKLYQFGTSRGFESDILFKTIDSILKE